MEEASFFLAPLQKHPGIRAAFVERIEGIETSTDKEATLELLRPHHCLAAHQLGFTNTHLTGQVHGNQLVVVDHEAPLMSSGADGLLSQNPGILLGIHVADCGAIYLADQRTGAIGLLHSGKKGTELNITAAAIEKMSSDFGSKPADIVTVLAPCIRPPHYEIDFAQEIKRQALKAGILPSNYHDCGLCTASDLKRFYSYRIEQGNTGRMLALLGHLSP